jgi:cystathionine beta-lyase/cystathionine gamma-synthase
MAIVYANRGVEASRKKKRDKLLFGFGIRVYIGDAYEAPTALNTTRTNRTLSLRLLHHHLSAGD